MITLKKAAGVGPGQRRRIRRNQGIRSAVGRSAFDIVTSCVGGGIPMQNHARVFGCRRQSHRRIRQVQRQQLIRPQRIRGRNVIGAQRAAVNPKLIQTEVKIRIAAVKRASNIAA